MGVGIGVGLGAGVTTGDGVGVGVGNRRWRRSWRRSRSRSRCRCRCWRRSRSRSWRGSRSRGRGRCRSRSWRRCRRGRGRCCRAGATGSHRTNIAFCHHHVVVPFRGRLRGLVRAQDHVGVVYSERRNRSHVQVGQIRRELSVYPPFQLAVILSRRVHSHHELVAVPLPALRQMVRHRFEVRILRRIE